MTENDAPARITAAFDDLEPSAAFRSRVEAQLAQANDLAKRQRRWLPYSIAAAVVATVITAAIATTSFHSRRPTVQSPAATSSTAGSFTKTLSIPDIQGTWTLSAVIDSGTRLTASPYPAVLELTAREFRFTTTCAMTSGAFALQNASITFQGDTSAVGCINPTDPSVAKPREVLELRLFEGIAQVTLSADGDTLTLDLHSDTMIFLRAADHATLPQHLPPLSIADMAPALSTTPETLPASHAAGSVSSPSS